MPPFPVNLAALVAVEAALADGSTRLKYVLQVQLTGAWFAQELSKLNVKTYPSGGNFLLAKFGPGGPALFQKLEKQGILLRDKSKEMGPGFVRITIGTQVEMQRLLSAIRKEWKVRT
jgi:histidinol-phosphate aminotransferase